MESKIKIDNSKIGIIYILICSLIFGGLAAHRLYIYTYGKDIEVTVTDVKVARNLEEVSFVYEKETQNVIIPHFISSYGIKVGDIEHVRKCENMDLFVSCRVFGWYLFMFIAASIILLIFSLIIYGYSLFHFFVEFLVKALHHSPFRYFRITKRLKNRIECQYDIEVVDNIKYEIMSGSTCTLIGYSGEIKEVDIPIEVCIRGKRYKVTNYGDECFKDCTSLSSIHLSETITTLSSSCFKGCTALTNINLETITALGSSCFEGCTSLTSIRLPDSITELGDSCFKGCSALTNINLETITALGSSCFEGCTSLTCIHLPDSVTELGNSCFKGCTALCNIELPESLTALGDRCFAECGSLTNMHLPDSITILGQFCFSRCTSLRSIDLPDSITVLGNGGFSYCTSLACIHLSNSITALGDYCFSGCTSLASISLPDSIIVLGNSCFEKCTSLTNITLPDSITALGDYCFSGCTSLSSIHLPDSINVLENYCFYGCSSLKKIELPDSITTIYDDCFEGCSSLANIKLPEKIFYVKLGKCPYANKHEHLVKRNIKEVNAIIEILEKETVRVVREGSFETRIGENYCEISMSINKFGKRVITKTFVYKITELPDKVEEIKSNFFALYNGHED